MQSVTVKPVALDAARVTSFERPANAKKAAIPPHPFQPASKEPGSPKSSPATAKLTPPPSEEYQEPKRAASGEFLRASLGTETAALPGQESHGQPAAPQSGATTPEPDATKVDPLKPTALPQPEAKKTRPSPAKGADTGPGFDKRRAADFLREITEEED